MKSYLKFAALGLGIGLGLMLGDMAVGGRLLFGMEDKTCGVYFIAALLVTSRRTKPLETFVRCLLTAAGMGVVLAAYLIRPQSPTELLVPAAIWLASGGLGADCAAFRDRYRLWVANSLIWLTLVAAEGLNMLTLYFTLGKGLPLAAIDIVGGGVCLWIVLGHEKKVPDDGTEQQPDYPTDEEGNRLPDGDEQWLL